MGKIGMDMKAFYKGLYGKLVIHDWVGRVVLPIQILLISAAKALTSFEM